MDLKESLKILKGKPRKTQEKDYATHSDVLKMCSKTKHYPIVFNSLLFARHSLKWTKIDRHKTR